MSARDPNSCPHDCVALHSPRHRSGPSVVGVGSDSGGVCVRVCRHPHVVTHMQELKDSWRLVYSPSALSETKSLCFFLNMPR